MPILVFPAKTMSFLVFELLFALLSFAVLVFPATEKEILLEFKLNISEDPLRVLESWSSESESPCRNWTGVTCNGNGIVEKIRLRNANLAGVLSTSLSGLRSLRSLTLSGNRFRGNVPLEIAEIRTLMKLNLSENGFSGSIPGNLGLLSSLRLLDLSKNDFTGTIPESLFVNCFKMRYIAISHNNLYGSIPASIANCGKLEGIDFSFNNLSGDFPDQICISPNMVHVSLRSNFLSGAVSDKMISCEKLEFLDIGSNRFTGSLGVELLSLSNLTYLAVGENFLSSVLLPEILTLSKLNHFNASFNNLNGGFPEIRNCGGEMEVFDVSGNGFSGPIGTSIANCRRLKVLNLGFNRLSGAIPVELGNFKWLTVLRLGNNLLSGAIPPALGSIELLQILDLHHLLLVGEIPIVLTNCRFLLHLDFSENNLQGPIPETIYNLTYLEILDLHQNRINGSIPSNLGELSGLQFLDLSNNFLSGPIPLSIGNLTQLTQLNFSTNNLTGPIPVSIQRFGFVAFANNPGLCGPPLNTVCSGKGNGTTPAARKTRLLSVSAIVAIVAAAIIFIGVCVITFVNIRASRKRIAEVLISESTPASTESNIIIGKLVLFSKSLPSKYEDWEAGTKALLDKDCLIGGGSIGTVYRTTFEGGISIAVKKLETLGTIRTQDEFEHEIGRLGNLQHPNLVAFQGYYWSSTMQLILSEFIPNGNLYQHLHESNSSGRSRSEFDWSRRFGVAIGIARALAFLHHDCSPQVLHLNIKSTNILLDEQYEPKLSDYGLGRLLLMMDNYVLTRFHTAVGYVAPELAQQSMRFSDKCDVYSFGIILLELVTGRKPVESPAATEVVVLCDYVRGLLESGTASVCFDRSLRGFAENEVMQVLKLGIICTSDVPSRRPSMAEVVQVLESIKPASDT